MPLVDGLHRALTATYRTRTLDSTYFERRQSGQDVRCIYALWHELLFLTIPRMRRQNVCVLISTHRDGELIARVVARQGYRLARGSSTRGGVRGLRELLRAASDPDSDLAFTVDGPRGPRRVVKPGVLAAAQLTGRPIVPVAAAVDRAWRLGSWDRLAIGKPAARVVVGLGEPVWVAPESNRETLAADHGPRLAASMEAAEHRCQMTLAAWGQARSGSGD